jgi:gas vesicle protein
MAQKKKQEDLSSAQRIGIGVGITAAAVAAASTYFLYGSKSAAKNRKSVKSWMLKAKAEVLEKLEDAKNMSQEEYEELINTIAGTYSELKSASRVDIKSFKEEMKDHWKAIEKSATPKKKVAKKAPAKKVAKKAPAKKVAKKTAKK